MDNRCSSVAADLSSQYFNFYVSGVKYVGKPASIGAFIGATREYVVFLPATWPNGTFEGAVIGQVVPSSSWECTDPLAATPRPTIDTLTLQAPATPLISIGGFVSGLGFGESVVLLNNGVGATTVSANGPYFHNTAVADGAAYAITVQTPPAGKVCTVTALGSGTANGPNNVVSANVSCAAPLPYTIGGTVSGLTTGETVILKNNGADDKSVGANGSFTFTTSILSGSAYAVTVGTAPAGKTCTVSNGSGTVGSANVTNVTVACAAPVAAATSIPTLSEWGMIFLSSLIAMVGIATVRRRNGGM